ncbi:MAG: hypothetical protein M8357_03465 [Desulfobulbaceae bacterium]|nr:hypothetical protein [Desulfobulbaceae bacterium]
MAKKIAVLVRDRQSEALRMAIGIILLDDIIEVYILDKKIEETEQNQLYLETIQDLEIKAYTNVEGNYTIEYLPTEEIARQLSDYDHVLAY